MPTCPYCQLHPEILPGATSCKLCNTILVTSNGSPADLHWWESLCSYCYCVNFSTYAHAQGRPNFTGSSGNRATTRKLEISFQQWVNGPTPTNGTEPITIFFWKMFSQGDRANKEAKKLDDFLHDPISGSQRQLNLQQAIRAFVSNAMPTIQQATDLIQSSGLSKNSKSPSALRIALAFTLPAFASPTQFPMVDNEVAEWVNTYGLHHNVWASGKVRPTPLVRFRKKTTTLEPVPFEQIF